MSDRDLRKRQVPKGVFCHPSSQPAEKRDIADKNKDDEAQFIADLQLFQNYVIQEIDADHLISEPDSGSQTSSFFSDELERQNGDLKNFVPEEGEDEYDLKTPPVNRLKRNRKGGKSFESARSKEDGQEMLDSDAGFEISVEEIDQFMVCLSDSLPDNKVGDAVSSSNLEQKEDDAANATVGKAMKALLDARKNEATESFIQYGSRTVPTINGPELPNKYKDVQGKLSYAVQTDSLPSTSSDLNKSIHESPAASSLVAPKNSLAPIQTKGNSSAEKSSNSKLLLSLAAFVGLISIVAFGVMNDWDVIEEIYKDKAEATHSSSVGQKGHYGDLQRSRENLQETQLNPSEGTEVSLAKDPDLDETKDDMTMSEESAAGNEDTVETQKPPIGDVNPDSPKKTAQQVGKIASQKATAARGSESAPTKTFKKQFEKVAASSAGATKRARELPETPSKAMIVESLSQARPEVQACAQGTNGIAELDITIKNTGRVAHVVVRGDFMGAKEGSCIARVIRDVRFNPFKRPSFRVLYPFSL